MRSGSAVPRFRGENRPSLRHTLTCMSSSALGIGPELDTVATVCRSLVGLGGAYSRILVASDPTSLSRAQGLGPDQVLTSPRSATRTPPDPLLTVGIRHPLRPPGLARKTRRSDEPAERRRVRTSSERGREFVVVADRNEASGLMDNDAFARDG